MKLPSTIKTDNPIPWGLSPSELAHTVCGECIFLSKTFHFSMAASWIFSFENQYILGGSPRTPWDINISLAPLSFLLLFLFLTALPQCGLLVPRLGIKRVSPALAAQLHHWSAREVPLSFPAAQPVTQNHILDTRECFQCIKLKTPALPSHKHNLGLSILTSSLPAPEFCPFGEMSSKGKEDLKNYLCL